MRVADTPRSRCAAVFVGFNRVQGAVAGVVRTRAHYSGEEVPWWRATLEHEWQVVTETKRTDSEGNVHTELHESFQFHQVSWWASPTVFDIVDDTGSVRLDVANARVNAPVRLWREEGERRPLPMQPGSRPTGVIRKVEYRLHDGDVVFCLGYARVDPSGTALIIDGKGNDEFLVSIDSPTAVARNRRAGTWALGLTGVGIPMATAGTAEWAMVRGGIASAVALAWSTVMVWNRLLRVREMQQRAWSLIDVQLDRRAVLIPQLVTVASAYLAHEASLQAELAALRQSNDGRWQVLVERYPTLKGDTVTKKVIDELRDTETKVAAARAYFNDAVTVLRDRTGALPGALLVPLARQGRFGSMDLIEAGDEARRAVDLRRLLGTPPAATN